MTTISSTRAVILAGGRGLRLGGVVKGALTVGGVPMLHRVAGSLGDVATPILVAAGPEPMHALPLDDRMQAIADPVGWAGPLAGIVAAARTVGSDALLSVAVDTPFFPPEFLDVARHTIATADVAIARHRDQAYFTNALWSRSALERLRNTTSTATSSSGIKGFVRELTVAWVDWPEHMGGDPFANANTPQDLHDLERRAAENGVGKVGQTR